MNPESSEGADPFICSAIGFWQRNGGRMTIVRQIICQSIAARDLAFSSEELWKECRKNDPGISLTSIYRTLSDLAGAGLLREIHGPSEQRCYVKANSTSAATGHLICKDCHKIIPLSDGCLALREGAMIRGLGFETGNMHLQIEAACESLKRCGTCDQNTPPG